MLKECFLFVLCPIQPSQISLESIKPVLCSHPWKDFESADVKLIQKACSSSKCVFFRVNAIIIKDIDHFVSVTFLLSHSVHYDL